MLFEALGTTEASGDKKLEDMIEVRSGEIHSRHKQQFSVSQCLTSAMELNLRLNRIQIFHQMWYKILKAAAFLIEHPKAK